MSRVRTLSLFLSSLTMMASVSQARPEDPPARTIATHALQPHMAIRGDGVFIAFIHRGNIAVSVSQDNGRTFSDPQIAIDVGGRARGGRHRGPRIGVDSHGRLTVTAPVTFDDEEYKKRFPTADLYFVTSPDGGQTWTAPKRINRVAKKAPEALHWMAVSPGGDVHVAWLDRRDRTGRGQDIYYARISDGQVQSNTRVATTVCECCAPGLAVDESGNPTIAWREGGEKPSREIFAIRSADNGNTFSLPVRINRTQTLEDG